ncbi:MAG: hypothetical protein U0359_33380 [Byssovorax sp.]
MSSTPLVLRAAPHHAGLVGLIAFAVVACVGPTAPGPVPDRSAEARATASVAATESPSASAAPPPADPCEGALIDLGAVLGDARCVFADEALANALRADFRRTFSSAPPAVEGSQIDADHVEVKIPNRAATPLVLPLFLSQSTSTFPVTARSKGRERSLVDAKPEISTHTAQWSARTFARVVIAPGGTAALRLRIDPRTTTTSFAGCPPNAKCSPDTIVTGKLAPGSYTLVIDLPFYGLPPMTATVSWTQK